MTKKDAIRINEIADEGHSDGGVGRVMQEFGLKKIADAREWLRLAGEKRQRKNPEKEDA